MVNIFGICAEGYKSSINDIVKSGNYDVVPAVFVSDGKKSEKYFYKKPFRIFEKNMDLEFVGNIVSKYEDNLNFFKLPRESYKKLTSVVDKNLEKILADMVSTQIMRLLEDHKDEENIIFISNMPSDKIIGRLGYLFLDYKKTTIAFIFHKPSHLMTNIVNKGLLEFDFNYSFGEDKHIAGTISPDNNTHGMLTSFLYNISLKTDKPVAPLRIDIFSQNMSIKDISNKCEVIDGILSESKNLSSPVEDENVDEYYTRLPKALLDVLNYKENFKTEAARIINER